MGENRFRIEKINTQGVGGKKKRLICVRRKKKKRRRNVGSKSDESETQVGKFRLKKTVRVWFWCVTSSRKQK